MLPHEIVKNKDIASRMKLGERSKGCGREEFEDIKRKLTVYVAHG